MERIRWLDCLIECLHGEYTKNILIQAATYVKFDRICLRYFNLKQNTTCGTKKKKIKNMIPFLNMGQSYGIVYAINPIYY